MEWNNYVEYQKQLVNQVAHTDENSTVNALHKRNDTQSEIQLATTKILPHVRIYDHIL